MTNAVIYFDGGGENPGLMRISYVIQMPTREKVYEYIDVGVYGTSNQAEWLSLIYALKECIEMGVKSVEIYGDSNLVVRSANNEWKIRNERLKDFKAEYDRLKKEIFIQKIKWIPRDSNYAGHLLEGGSVKDKAIEKYLNASYDISPIRDYEKDLKGSQKKKNKINSY